MAHAAEIDNNNIVIRVLVVPDNQEHRVQEYLSDDLGLGGTWLQASYNSRIRYNYPGLGFSYDPIDDAFIAPMLDCGHEEVNLSADKKWECSNEAHTL